MKSIFLRKQGESSKNKVLDFFIVHSDFNYSLKEIAKYYRVSYPCMKQLKKELIKNKWIILTRKVGKAQMYKLNTRSQKVLKYVDFYWSVVSEEVKKHLNIVQENIDSYPAAVASFTKGS